MHGLENGAFVADVTRGSETKTTNQAGAHVRHDVAVEVGHDQNFVVVGRGICDDFQAGVVQNLGVELNVGEFLGYFAGGIHEETVGHLHDGCFVDGAYFEPANVLGVLEGVAQDALRCLTRDEFDALDDAVDYHVLDARVFSFGVFADQDGVDVVVGGFVTFERAARADVGEEVECSSECEVEGDVTLSNWRLLSVLVCCYSAEI